MNNCILLIYFLCKLDALEFTFFFRSHILFSLGLAFLLGIPSPAQLKDSSDIWNWTSHSVLTDSQEAKRFALPLSYNASPNALKSSFSASSEFYLLKSWWAKVYLRVKNLNLCASILMFENNHTFSYSVANKQLKMSTGITVCW